MLSQDESRMEPMMRYFLHISPNTQHYKASNTSLNLVYLHLTRSIWSKTVVLKNEYFSIILLVIVKLAML